MRRAGWLLLACACGPASPRAHAPTPVSVDSTRTPPVTVAREDADVVRRRVLASFDGGDPRVMLDALHDHERPVEAALHAAIARGTRFANVAPVRVAALPPPPTASTKPGKLVAVRGPAPSKYQEALSAARGEYFRDPEESQGGTEQKLPTWLPERVGEEHLRYLRAADGRWLATFGERFIAVHGEKPALLDFGAWDDGRGAEGVTVRWAELGGGAVYAFAAVRFGGSFLVAVDLQTGKVLWRSEDMLISERFAVGTNVIVAWRHLPAFGGARAGELISIDRTTGTVVARRPSPELDAGDGDVLLDDGHIYCVPGSTLAGGKGMKHDEALEVREAATAAPPPAAPDGSRPERLAVLPTPTGADARLTAWKQIDAGDPRAAILSLRPFLASRPTDFAAAAIAVAARRGLAAVRAKAEADILATHPAVLASDANPIGRAPVARPKARHLKIVSQRKSSSLRAPYSDLPTPSDELTLAPAYVPERLGNRGRNADAGAFTADYRVEVYWGYSALSWTVLFRAGSVVSVLEHPREVRAAGAVGDVLLTVNNAGSGPFFLEARDATKGTLYYRAKDELHDQYFVIRDGYVIASTRPKQGSAKPRAEVVLIEADTGTLVDRAKLPPTEEPFLIFESKGEILAVNGGVSATLALE